MDYQAYLQTDGWKKRRAWALQFWGNRCALCNSPDKPEVHHRTYERVGKELLSDLIVLCDKCHARHHGVLPTEVTDPYKLIELSFSRR